MKDVKILIVEDDDLLRGVLEEKIINKGCAVFTAEDGVKALQKINEHMPDLVLLDLILPKMGGFDVLELIKKEEALKHIPVVIISNLGEERDVAKALELGAAGFFVKSNNTLEEIVGKAFDVLEKTKE